MSTGTSTTDDLVKRDLGTLRFDVHRGARHGVRAVSWAAPPAKGQHLPRAGADSDRAKSEFSKLRDPLD